MIGVSLFVFRAGVMCFELTLGVWRMVLYCNILYYYITYIYIYIYLFIYSTSSNLSPPYLIHSQSIKRILSPISNLFHPSIILSSTFILYVSVFIVRYLYLPLIIHQPLITKTDPACFIGVDGWGVMCLIVYELGSSLCWWKVIDVSCWWMVIGVFCSGFWACERIVD
jgi:hypothetical protein